MVSIMSLWLPIIVGAILVWIASALVWTVMPHRKSEWKGVPDEDGMRNALRAQSLRPGQYSVPYPPEGRMKNPAYMQKLSEGPVAMFTVTPPGFGLKMGPPMVLSVLFYIVVGIVVAYVTGRTMEPGDSYLAVFRVAGTTAWLAYGFATVPESIWFGRPWSSTIKTLIEALAYGLLTAGAFGAFWPDA